METVDNKSVLESLKDSANEDGGYPDGDNVVYVYPTETSGFRVLGEPELMGVCVVMPIEPFSGHFEEFCSGLPLSHTELKDATVYLVISQGEFKRIYRVQGDYLHKGYIIHNWGRFCEGTEEAEVDVEESDTEITNTGTRYVLIPMSDAKFRVISDYVEGKDGYYLRIEPLDRWFRKKGTDVIIHGKYPRLKVIETWLYVSDRKLAEALQKGMVVEHWETFKAQVMGTTQTEELESPYSVLGGDGNE